MQSHKVVQKKKTALGRQPNDFRGGRAHLRRFFFLSFLVCLFIRDSSFLSFFTSLVLVLSHAHAPQVLLAVVCVCVGGGGQAPHLSLLLLRWPASPARPALLAFLLPFGERAWRGGGGEVLCVCESLSACVRGCLRACVRVCLGARQCESVREWAGPRPSEGDSFMTMSEERGPPHPLLLSSSFPSLPSFFLSLPPAHRPAHCEKHRKGGREVIGCTAANK